MSLMMNIFILSNQIFAYSSIDYIKLNLKRIYCSCLLSWTLMDYITVSPIRTGRRDTLKVDDIIIFEFITPFRIHTCKMMTNCIETEIVCITFSFSLFSTICWSRFGAYIYRWLSINICESYIIQQFSFEDGRDSPMINAITHIDECTRNVHMYVYIFHEHLLKEKFQKSYVTFHAFYFRSCSAKTRTNDTHIVRQLKLRIRSFPLCFVLEWRQEVLLVLHEKISIRFQICRLINYSVKMI